MSATKLPAPRRLNDEQQTLSESIEEKIRVDKLNFSQHHSFESDAKKELASTKESLVENFARLEEGLRTQLADTIADYQWQLNEKERILSASITDKQLTIDHLHRQIQDEKSRYESEILNAKEDAKKRLDDQEAFWKGNFAEMERKHIIHIKSFADKASIDRSTKNLIEKSKVEAKEVEMRSLCDKKLHKYEKLLRKVIQHYKQKDLIITGALNEARREVICLQAEREAKEESLSEELRMKDRRWIAVQTRLGTVDDLQRMAAVWRDTARELCTHIVKVSAEAEDLPKVPVQNNDVLTEILQNLAAQTRQFGAGNSRESKRLQEYQELRCKTVIVKRKALQRALRLSKRVLERIDAEIIPDLDPSPDF